MKALLLLLLAGQAWAMPSWLSLGGGLRFGAGPSQFSGEARATNSGGLFGANTTQQRQASLAGSAGIYLRSGYQGLVSHEIQVELSGFQQASKAVQDLGSGIFLEVEHQRAELEWPIMLRESYLLPLEKMDLRFFVAGGYWTSRLLQARLQSGVQGGMPAKEFEWKNGPLFDWGYCASLGVEMFLKGLPVLRRVGLEGRWRQGRQDLDPKGAFEQVSNSVQVILTLGY